MKKYILTIGLAVFTLLSLWWLSRPLDVSELTPPVSVLQDVPPVPQPERVLAGAEPQAEQAQGEPELEAALDPEAIESLAQARLKGDQRAPQVHKSSARQAPAPDIIRDEIAYAAYETAQQKKIYRAYVDAALPKVRELQVLVNQAKQQGDIPAEEIQAAEDKIAGILQMREQLLRDNPDLMNPEYAAGSHAIPDAGPQVSLDDL